MAAILPASDQDIAWESVNEQSSLLSRTSSEDPLQILGNDGKITSLTCRSCLLCAAIILLLGLLSIGGLLQALPLNQVLESILCAQLHFDQYSGIQCGENSDVQAELATLRAWQTVFGLAPGLLLAVPYGLMADRHGRKIVLILCILGIALGHVYYAVVCWWPHVFPVRLIWLSPAFHLIGGGGTVLNSTIFSILSDLLPDDYRSTGFFSLGATVLIFELIGSPLTSHLMKSDTWLPIFIGLSLYIPILIGALCLPETLGVSQVEVKPTWVPSTSVSGSDSEQHGIERQQHTRRLSWLQKSGIGLSRRWSSTSSVIQENGTVSLLLLTFLCTVLGNEANEILLQFARRRFGWSWSQTGWIVFLQAGLALLLLTVILPVVNYMLRNMMLLSTARKDLVIARMSCLFLLGGNLVIGSASTDIIMLLGTSMWCLGSGYTLVLRSLIAQLVEPYHRNIILTAVAIMGHIGTAIGSPLFAFCFRIGLSLSDGRYGQEKAVWIGLPFGVAAAFLSITLVVLCRIRLQ